MLRLKCNKFLQHLFQATSLLYISLDYYVITLLRYYVQTCFYGTIPNLKLQSGTVGPIQFFVFKILRFNRSFTVQYNCNCLMLIKYWNARDRWFKPAQFYLYFCIRKATHGLSNVTLGCVLYGTISTRVPFRPTTVQVSN
jgi:hypothetical protein